MVTFFVPQCFYKIEILINKLLDAAMYNILGHFGAYGRFFDIYTDDGDNFIWAYKKNNIYRMSIYCKTHMNFDVRYKDLI